MFRFAGNILFALTAATLLPILADAQTDGASKPSFASEIKFVIHRVGSFRSEACGVGEFNDDGKLDIVAGP